MSGRKKLKSGGHKHNRVDWIMGMVYEGFTNSWGISVIAATSKRRFFPFPDPIHFTSFHQGGVQSSVYQTYAQLFHQVGDLNSWIIKHTIGIYTLNFGRQAVSSHCCFCWKKMPETTSTRINLTMAFNGSNALPCPRDYHWERGRRRWHKRSKGSPRKLARCRILGILGIRSISKALQNPRTSSNESSESSESSKVPNLSLDPSGFVLGFTEVILMSRKSIQLWSANHVYF